MHKNIFQSNNNSKMSIFEHLYELRQRFFLILIFFVITAIISMLLLKQLIFTLQLPAKGVKFFQLAPGEFFFVSVKVALYNAVILSCPFTLYQLILFILPGLTFNESKIMIPIFIGSTILFFFGIVFGYTIIVPASLTFFLSYGANIIEPIWSFEQYCDFILMVLLSTGLAFQIPILQLILGLLNILSSKQMLSIWKYVILITTIVAAVITPSTDPFTQVIMSLALFGLYMNGIGLLKLFKK